jgi:hypothetical protein
MWIDGVSPLHVTHAFIASIAAFAIFGTIGAIQQDRYNRIQKDPSADLKVDFIKIGIVFFILISAIFTNYYYDFQHWEFG